MDSNIYAHFFYTASSSLISAGFLWQLTEAIKQNKILNNFSNSLFIDEIPFLNFSSISFCESTDCIFQDDYTFF